MDIILKLGASLVGLGTCQGSKFRVWRALLACHLPNRKSISGAGRMISSSKRRPVPDLFMDGCMGLGFLGDFFCSSVYCFVFFDTQNNAVGQVMKNMAGK